MIKFFRSKATYIFGNGVSSRWRGGVVVPSKVQVKLSLCLTNNKYYAMKAHGAVDVEIHIFLTSALDGGEWSASLPGHFTPGERDPYTHWIGGWVGPRASLDDVEKILDPTETRNDFSE
jgi:hypothetical protein